MSKKFTGYLHLETLRVHTSYSDNYKNNAILDTTELVMRIR